MYRFLYVLYPRLYFFGLLFWFLGIVWCIGFLVLVGGFVFFYFFFMLLVVSSVLWIVIVM